jgi:hypothetical protein
MYECRCDERLKAKADGSTRLAYAGLRLLVLHVSHPRILHKLFMNQIHHLETSQVYLQQIKKKAEAEGKNCHAKTMLSLEKPITLI